MNTASLAHALRQRQYALGEVPRAMIDALSDGEMIEMYVTCSCCSEPQVTPWELRKAIFLARDADSFVGAVDALRRSHA